MATHTWRVISSANPPSGCARRLIFAWTISSPAATCRWSPLAAWTSRSPITSRCGPSSRCPGGREARAVDRRGLERPAVRCLLHLRADSAGGVLLLLRAAPFALVLRSPARHRALHPGLHRAPRQARGRAAADGVRPHLRPAVELHLALAALRSPRAAGKGFAPLREHRHGDGALAHLPARRAAAALLVPVAAGARERDLRRPPRLLALGGPVHGARLRQQVHGPLPAARSLALPLRLAPSSPLPARPLALSFARARARRDAARLCVERAAQVRLVSLPEPRSHRRGLPPRGTPPRGVGGNAGGPLRSRHARRAGPRPRARAAAAPPARPLPRGLLPPALRALRRPLPRHAGEAQLDDAVLSDGRAARRARAPAQVGCAQLEDHLRPAPSPAGRAALLPGAHPQR